MRDRVRRWGIAAAGATFAVIGEWTALQGGRAPNDALLHLAIGLTYLYGGLAIWAHEPANRTGRLMSLVGVTWFLGTLSFSPIPPVTEVGLALDDAFAPVLLALILAYPTGRLDRRLDRAAVVILAVGTTALNIVFSTSLLSIEDKSIGLYGGLALASMTAAVVIWRWASASPRSRPDLLPVLVAGLVFLSAILINIVRRIAHIPDELGALLLAAKDLAPAAVPLALLIGFYRQSERRSKALVEALPDRMLRYTRDGHFVSADPPALGDGDTATPVGETLHARMFGVASDQARAAAERALETGQLQAFDFALEVPGGRRELEARVAPSGPEEVTAILRDFTDRRAVEAELRSSRARIVEAADNERRRLERDLHDGAQQRLVSLALALRLLRRRVAGGGDQDGIAKAVDEAAGELRSAIAELRELARGIHPAILTEAGLGAAITALAERSTVPATVTALPERRLAAEVEATAYFVVSEALANAAKYANATTANVAASVDSSTLRVEVGDDGGGGADSARGTGLRGLQDRVAAVGGRLTIDSPLGGGTRVVAEIPAG
jgi:signal transduction histidine kinase